MLANKTEFSATEPQKVRIVPEQIQIIKKALQGLCLSGISKSIPPAAQRGHGKLQLILPLEPAGSHHVRFWLAKRSPNSMGCGAAVAPHPASLVARAQWATTPSHVGEGSWVGYFSSRDISRMLGYDSAYNMYCKKSFILEKNKFRKFLQPFFYKSGQIRWPQLPYLPLHHVFSLHMKEPYPQVPCSVGLQGP